MMTYHFRDAALIVYIWPRYFFTTINPHSEFSRWSSDESWRL